MIEDNVKGGREKSFLQKSFSSFSKNFILKKCVDIYNFQH